MDVEKLFGVYGGVILVQVVNALGIMRRLAKALVMLAVSGTPRDLGGKKRDHRMLQEHVLGVVHQVILGGHLPSDVFGHHPTSNW